MRNFDNSSVNGKIWWSKFVPADYPEEHKLTEGLASQLEEAINHSFQERGMELIPGYFSSPYFQQHFAYMLLGKEPEKEDRIVGGVIAMQMRTEKRTPFVLYDKIFLRPAFRGNGHLGKMLGFVRNLDEELLRRGLIAMEESMAGLRTSDDAAHSRYISHSSTFFPVDSSHGAETIKYFVHLFEGDYLKWREVAHYIAALPPTMRKITPLARSPTPTNEVGVYTVGKT